MPSPLAMASSVGILGIHIPLSIRLMLDCLTPDNSDNSFLNSGSCKLSSKSFSKSSIVHSPLIIRFVFQSSVKLCLWCPLCFLDKRKNDEHKAVLVLSALEIKKAPALSGKCFLRPSDWSRTSGLLNPIQARYQSALHPDTTLMIISLNFCFCNCYNTQRKA